MFTPWYSWDPAKFGVKLQSVIQSDHHNMMRLNFCHGICLDWNKFYIKNIRIFILGGINNIECLFHKETIFTDFYNKYESWFHQLTSEECSNWTWSTSKGEQHLCIHDQSSEQLVLFCFSYMYDYFICSWWWRRRDLWESDVVRQGSFILSWFFITVWVTI